MKKLTPDNLELLQNIEFGICTGYRSDRSLLDIDAKDAIDALVRRYRAEDESRTPPNLPLSAPAQRVFDGVAVLCEWRLGRGTFQGDLISQPVALPALLDALRTIQKSIPMWSKRGGRQGYLDFVIQYLP